MKRIKMYGRHSLGAILLEACSSREIPLQLEYRHTAMLPTWNILLFIVFSCNLAHDSVERSPASSIIKFIYYLSSSYKVLKTNRSQPPVLLYRHLKLVSSNISATICATEDFFCACSQAIAHNVFT